MFVACCLKDGWAATLVRECYGVWLAKDLGVFLARAKPASF